MSEALNVVAITESETIPVNVTVATDSISIPVGITYGGGSEYTGSYHVIPSDASQTLSTRAKVMTADVVIDPIPSNYGLVTWNGAVLTIT